MTRYDALIELCMVRHTYAERLRIAHLDRSLSRELRASLIANLERRTAALQKAIDVLSAPRHEPL